MSKLLAQLVFLCILQFTRGLRIVGTNLLIEEIMLAQDLLCIEDKSPKGDCGVSKRDLCILFKTNLLEKVMLAQETLASGSR
jgi:hypothetical protein